MDLHAALINHGMGLLMSLGGGEGGGLPPDEEMPEMRAMANRVTRAIMLPLDPVSGVEITEDEIPTSAGSMRARVYTPEGPGPFPVVYYMHGGAFWVGEELDLWDARLTRISRGAEAIVVSVDYRLAPEDPFPAAVEDTWEGLQFVSENAERWNADGARIAVMGGSAGGNLAAVLAHRARDEGGPALALQILVVPVVRQDDTLSPEMRALANYLHGPEDPPSEEPYSMRNRYITDRADLEHPWASPLFAERFDGMAPAVILTAQFDTLRGQGEDYADRLRAAGVPVRYQSAAGAIHGFSGSPAAAERGIDVVVEELNAAFGRTG